MRTNEPPGEVVTVPTRQKETEIFIVEGTLSYVNCAIRRRNFAVLRNSVNSPATSVIDFDAGNPGPVIDGPVFFFQIA